MTKRGLRSSDVSAAEDGEPKHWLLRHRHRQHIARMKSGGGLGSKPMPEDATRTRFLKSISLPEAEKHITKSGGHSPKVGDLIVKTEWKGRRIRMLTLEERMTCPRACENWTTCYGNAMPFAHRLRHGADLEMHLFLEMEEIGDSGIVVRLHQLGDFYSQDYVTVWQKILERFDVNVFGYTAHPATSPIGRRLAVMAASMWERFAIRFSGHYQPDTVRRAITVKTEDEAAAAGAIVCPAQLGKTASCATCGLCWTSERDIAFLEH